MKTPGVIPKTGPKVKKYPFASIIGEMKPSTRMRTPSEVDAERAACDAAFAKACRFSEGRDLVEEVVVSNFWPLGKHRPRMTLVRMKLPVFGSAEREFCPCFYLSHVEDETDEEFINEVEQSASKILGEISEREYLSRRAIGCTMPRLNRVFEEMKVKYGDCKVPEKILKSVEDKATKASRSAVAPIALVWAESKKRKEGDAPKAVAKKRKVAKVVMDLAEEVAESVQGEPGVARPAGVAIEAQVSASHPDEDLMGSSLKAAAVAWAGMIMVNPLPCVLGDDFSEFEGDAAGAGSASASASASEETSVNAGWLAKAQHLEEPEAESKERPPLALPQGPEESQALCFWVIYFLLDWCVLLVCIYLSFLVFVFSWSDQGDGDAYPWGEACSGWGGSRQCGVARSSEGPFTRWGWSYRGRGPCC